MTKTNLYSVGLFAAVLVAAMLTGRTSAFAQCGPEEVPDVRTPGLLAPSVRWAAPVGRGGESLRLCTYC